MHFIDGVAVGSINYAELEERQPQQEKEPAAKPAPTSKAAKGATITSGDVT